MKERKIKAIIVDDEAGCISNLQYYLSKYCPQVEVIATGNTTTDMLRLAPETFDVAFLDIELNNTNIFTVLSDTTDLHFDIVFVTAYEKYALKAFDVDVLDYILKPLNKEGILNCYHKILRRFQNADATPVNDEPGTEPVKQNNLIVKQGDKVYVISHKDIIYLEAKGIYTNIHFRYNGIKTVVLLCKPFSQLTFLYANSNFFRVHRSYIVNTNMIRDILKKDTVEVRMCTDDCIPIAKRRVSEFLTSVKL